MQQIIALPKVNDFLDKEQSAHKDYFDITIEELSLSNRTLGILMRCGVKTLAALMNTSIDTIHQ